MVSVSSLPFDILSSIFDHLGASDLVSLSLVCRAFLLIASLRLYKSVSFTQPQAKKYSTVITPFTSLLRHPHLADHVRICEITAIPLHKGQPNHIFIADCIEALKICHGLTKFTLAINLLPSFLSVLTSKESLRELSVNGSVTTEQAELLVKLRGLRRLHLEHASWCLLNIFPKWMQCLSPTLSHLSLTHSSDLNEDILSHILSNLPNLRSLRILSCMKINHDAVFRLLSLTPRLENLAVTTWEDPSLSVSSYADICCLRSLMLDTRNLLSTEAIHPLWNGIIGHTRACNSPLIALSLRLSQKQDISKNIVDKLINAHAGTLKKLQLSNCRIGDPSLEDIFRRCRKLEVLAITVPVRKLAPFTAILSHSQSLHTLYEMSDIHRTRTAIYSPVLNRQDVSAVMTRTRIRTIVSNGRIWKGSMDADNRLKIELERRKIAYSDVLTF